MTKFMDLIKTDTGRFWITNTVIIVFFVANLYLNSKYITRSEYEQGNARNNIEHVEMQKSLISIDKTLALMLRNELVLSDHSQRIQNLEVKTAELSVKVNK